MPSAGVNLAVVKTERYRKITQQAKQLIDDGAIGPMWMLRTISSFPIDVTRELSANAPLDGRPGQRRPVHGHGLAQHRLPPLADRRQRRQGLRPGEHLQRPGFARPRASWPRSSSTTASWGTCGSSSEFPAPGFPSSEVRFQVVGRDGMIDLENFEYLDLGKGDKWERI